jgi:uncharacterized protein with HEPN domain
LTILEDIDDIDQALKEFKCESMDDFLKKRLLQKCIVMSLINISEAIGELSEEFKAKHNQVNWKQFKKLRNIAAHKYGAVNFVVVWNIVQKNIPAFKQALTELVEG